MAAGIDINSPSNGVFLPFTKLGRNVPATPHIGGHSPKYWDTVNTTLENAVKGLNPNGSDIDNHYRCPFKNIF